MIDYKIKDVINPLSSGTTKLLGDVGMQADAFFEKRVKCDFAHNEIYKETEDQFRIRDDDILAIGMWRGEFWGKWIISACCVAAYENNAELKEFIHKSVLDAITTADDDGYIGSYKDPENVLPCDPEEGRKIYGKPLDFNWNVWCRKYTLWGLVEAYKLTEDKAILDAATKFANQLISMLCRLNIRIRECGTFKGLPAGSILKPMLMLYSITGDKKYFDFASSIVEDWEREDGENPNIIANALQNKPVHEWYPESEDWAKAYEMMSCFEGIIEYYRLTGCEKYLTSAKNIYELLWEHEQNTLFSVGFNDKFANASKYPNAISEPCDVIHWMRICSDLFRLTGDVKYMDTYELSFYNPFLAGAYKDGTWGARGVRTVGRHMTRQGQAKMKYSHCCVNNMPRAYVNAAENFVMKYTDGLVVNFYTDFVAKADIGDVVISGSYLKNGKVVIDIDAKTAFNLKLRIPSWSEKTLLDGKEIKAENGYYIVSLCKGKTTLNLEFSMKINLRELNDVPTRFYGEDFRIRRFREDPGVPEEIMTWDKRATLVYGPLLLTKSKLNGNTEEEMFDTETVAHKGYSIEITPVENDNVNYAFNVKFTSDNGTYETKMCDYASGTNIPSYDDDRFFNVFI